ncbi:glycosyl transferase family protein [Clostridium sp. DL-VIII]|uniref:ArnT family glycosyltransferase n=1 Tax=Clostridium sp. DL-VIII TaxID=641107 RepID=UPI00023B054C|nr:glycosyltransferase family 39 protein [Clostridium sp. DL-VIII]EHJ01417.1 glycosyl transferase family protein [Clostridium sp. DL-VIII]
MNYRKNMSRIKEKLNSQVKFNLYTSKIDLNKLIKYAEAQYILLAGSVIFFIAYICFRNLGTFPINNWDEARHGISGYEMIKNNQYIINTYAYEKDYWNLKPPLSFWIIALCIKSFGVSMFSIRFYSAISLLILTTLIGIFVLKRYGKIESLVSLLSFSASTQLYVKHVGRHADADALFILLFTISMISMLYIKDNKKFLYISGLSFGLAFLTKSFHSFLLVIIGGLFILFTGEIKRIKQKEWFLFILSFSVPIGLWVIARIRSDGFFFFKEMIKYDLLERTMEGVENNTPGFFYYFQYFFVGTGSSLRVVLIIIIMLGLSLNFKKLKKDESIAYILWIFIPLIIYTISKTKLDWYIMPIYIPIIIVASTMFGNIIRSVKLSRIFKIFLVLLFISVVIIHGMYMINFVENPPGNDLQAFIMNDLSNKNEIQGEDAYIDYGIGKLEQSVVMAAEISADLKCKEGGVEGFLENNHQGILIINSTMYKIHKEELKKFNLILQNEEYYVIAKT